MAKEYYEILEISETATESEIKKAYRKKAMEFHPDRNPGNAEAEAKFKKINEAYSCLSDSQKRANYDRFGSAEGMWGFGGGFQWGFDASDLGDIFSQFFGWGFGGNTGRRRRADIGEDIEIPVEISLEEAIRGTSKTVQYEKMTFCKTCNGKWGKTETCPKCQGSGTVRERIQTVFGVMDQAHTCPECNGTGEKVIEECDSCHGKWKIAEKLEKTIEVPKWIEDGMSMKLREEGNVGRDGNGDLYIAFSVANEENWLIRKDVNLHFTVKISPAEAALGAKKTIVLPILGKKPLDIRAGTQSETEIVFKNEWLPSLNRGGKVGNLIIKLVVEIPTRLTADEKRLYEALLIANGGKPKKWWLEEIFGA